MHPFTRSATAAALVLCAGALGPGLAQAYPGGTPAFVTDAAPYCASCHSSVSAAQLTGVPEARVQAELIANKHLAKIRTPAEGSPYAELTDEQRAALIRGIEQIDAASRVDLVTPDALEPGQVFEVTVTATGGGGPVVGIALVDADPRWQARPAASAGWHVLEKPSVVGPDGQAQTDFTDRRNPALAPGISYVNVYGVESDPGAGKFSSVSVTYRLRAPSQPGSYPLGVVMLYGTEKGAPFGAVETIQGDVPRGGFTANSGRVRFGEVRQIRVQ
jgi:mono/diheme cytochrome c family protein